MAKQFVSLGNQTGEGWFLTGEMLELIHNGVENIVCAQPFGCLPNHIVGKGVIKELRRSYPQSNIIAVDYDPGASEVNQLNRIKLMLATAQKNLKKNPSHPCLLYTSYINALSLAQFPAIDYGTDNVFFVYFFYFQFNQTIIN